MQSTRKLAEPATKEDTAKPCCVELCGKAEQEVIPQSWINKAVKPHAKHGVQDCNSPGEINLSSLNCLPQSGKSWQGETPYNPPLKIYLSHNMETIPITSTRQKYDKAYKKSIKRIECPLKKTTEYRELQKHANQAGLKPATFFKKAAFSYMNNASVPSTTLEANAQRLIFLLGNIANNINQIAKKTNTLKKITIIDLCKVKHKIYELEKAVEEFFKNSNNGHN